MCIYIVATSFFSAAASARPSSVEATALAHIYGSECELLLEVNEDGMAPSALPYL